MAKKKTKPETEDEAFLRRVNSNDATAEDKKKLRKYYDENPDYVREIGDLSNKAAEEILSLYMSGSFATREIYRQKIKLMREDFGWSYSSGIERILIEQICLTWLKLNIIEWASINKLRESHTVETGLYWGKMLEMAQRRHLKATESLAKVRMLLAAADLRQQQADEKRAKVARIAGKAVRQLTAGANDPIDVDTFKRVKEMNQSEII
jgi:hypothetical protein